MVDITYHSLKQCLQAVSDDPAFEARIILEDIAGLSQSDILTGNISPLSPDTKKAIAEILSKRQQGMPFWRALGYREFYGRPFHMNEDTLEPRPDTETLINAVLATVNKDDALNILDLGTGTGCIPITLLAELPKAKAIAVDIAPQALCQAQENAKLHGVDARFSPCESDWFQNIEGQFDLITSNPPYIDSCDVTNLAENVRGFDPILALDGGEKGLVPYEIIFSHIKKYLKPTGRAFFEIGYDQCGYIQGIADKYRIRICDIYRDIAGIPRVVEISCGDK